MFECTSDTLNVFFVNLIKLTSCPKPNLVSGLKHNESIEVQNSGKKTYSYLTYHSRNIIHASMTTLGCSFSFSVIAV